MRKAIVLVLGLSMLLGSAVQALASGDQMLRGVVSDSAGRPLADVRVELSEFGVGLLAVYQTDSKGRFRVDRTPKPTTLWQLQVSHEGYQSEESGWFSPAARLTQSFRLTPLYGNVQIAIQGPNSEFINGHVLLVGPGGAVVASEGFGQGRFVQQQVSPANFQVIVLASGYVPASHELVVEAGRTATGLVRLKRDRALVSGSVVDAVSGLGLPGARVEVIREGGGVGATVVSGVQGRFEVAVHLIETGRYYLRVEAPGYRSISTAEVELSHGQRYDFSGPDSPSLLPSTTRIDGVILLRGGGPAMEATVTLQLQGHGVVAEAKTNGQGEFRFDQVPAGPGLVYRMRADWPGDSVSTKWTEVSAGSITQVTLRPESSVTDVVGTGTLSGLVLSNAGSPVEGAKVEVLRRDQPSQSVTTDSFGAFVIHGLSATATDWFSLEPYTARITKEGYAVSYEFVVDGESATEFQLVDRLRTVIRATLYPESKTVSGQLFTTDGYLVTGQSVELHNDGGQAPQIQKTDWDGRYEFIVPLDRPGLGYSLRVAAQGFKQDAPLDVGDRVRKGLTLPTVWVESSTATFAGQVVDVAGVPAEGLLVQALGQNGAVRATTWTDSFGLFRLDFVLWPFEAKAVLVVTAKSGQGWALVTAPSHEIRWTIPDWDLQADR